MEKRISFKKSFIGTADQKIFVQDGNVDNAIITVVKDGFVMASKPIKGNEFVTSRILGPGESINSTFNLLLYELTKDVKINTIDKRDSANHDVAMQLVLSQLKTSLKYIEIQSRTLDHIDRFEALIKHLFLNHGEFKDQMITLPYGLTDYDFGELLNIDRSNFNRLKKEFKKKNSNLGFEIDSNRRYSISDSFVI